jgi:hypothetical protein
MVGVMNSYTKGSSSMYDVIDDVMDDDVEAWDDPAREWPSAS